MSQIFFSLFKSHFFVCKILEVIEPSNSCFDMFMLFLHQVSQNHIEIFFVNAQQLNFGWKNSRNSNSRFNESKTFQKMNFMEFLFLFDLLGNDTILSFRCCFEGGNFDWKNCAIMNNREKQKFSLTQQSRRWKLDQKKHLHNRNYPKHETSFFLPANYVSINDWSL